MKGSFDTYVLFITFGRNGPKLNSRPVHRGAFCQFPFRWIYYYGSNKSTGKETGKTHLCAVYCQQLYGILYSTWDIYLCKWLQSSYSDAAQSQFFRLLYFLIIGVLSIDLRNLITALRNCNWRKKQRRGSNHIGAHYITGNCIYLWYRPKSQK